MIIAMHKIKVSSELHHDVLNTVRPILGPTRVKPGCAGILLCRDMDDSDTMILIEEWETRKNFEDHIRSDEYRHILACLDLSSEHPEIKVNTISQKEGLEAIEKIRTGQLGS